MFLKQTPKAAEYKKYGKTNKNMYERKTNRIQKIFSGLMTAVLAFSSLISTFSLNVPAAQAAGTAAWTANGVVVAPNDAPPSSYHIGTQGNSIWSVPDGSGGSWSVFEDDSSGSYKTMLQHVDSSGARQLGAAGIDVASTSGDQRAPEIVSDGGTGVYVAWQDSRTGDSDIYVQRFDSSGTPLWTADGVAVATVSGDNEELFSLRENNHLLLSDGSNVYVAWIDDNDSYSVHAQKLDAATFTEQWTPGGVSISTNTYPPGADIALDGAGGLYATWQDQGGFTNAEVRAQHLDSFGAPTGTAGGVTIGTSTQPYYYSMDPRITEAGGDAIVAWNKPSGDASPGIRAQKIDTLIADQWTAGGVTVIATDDNANAQIVSDGSNGAYIAWSANHFPDHYYNILVQHLDSATGSVHSGWTAGGVAAANDTDYQDNPHITQDGSGGAVVAWDDTRNSFGEDLYAQDFNASGSPQWTVGGLQMTTHSYGGGYQFYLTNDGTDTHIAFKGVSTQSPFDEDVYANKINSSGATQWNGNDGARLQDFGGGILTYAENNAKLVADGSGKYFTAWTDSRLGNTSVWGQKVDSATGGSQWAAAGLKLAGVPGDDLSIVGMISDGAGGFLAAWNDTTINEGRVNRFDSNGSVHSGWPAGGVVASTDPIGIDSLVTDGSNGAVIEFVDQTNFNVKANRVLGNGAVNWGATGVDVSTPGNSSDYRTMDADGAGGAYFGWRDNFASLLLTRLQSDGTLASGWTLYGDLVSNAENVSRAEIKTVTGGVVMAWDQLPSPYTSSQVKAQKFNGSGSAQWADAGTGAGVQVETVANAQEPHLVAAGTGAIIDYKEFTHSYEDLYAQRLDGTTGARQWGNDGAAITNNTVNDSFEFAYIDTDGSNGAVIAWSDYRGGYPPDVYAQHIDSSGAVQWGVDGVAVAVRAAKYDQATAIVSNGSAGAVIAFQSEGSPYQIRMQDINDSPPATVGVHQLLPNGGESYAGGATTDISWSASGAIDHFKISLSTDSGSSYTTVITSSTPSSPYSWTVPATNTSTARIKVEALDSGNFVLASDESNSDFSITTSTDQYGYRWRSDNGSETSATYPIAQNAALVNAPKNTTERVRLGLSGPIGTDPDTVTSLIPTAGSGSGPYRLAMTPDGAYTYVADYFSSNGVYVIDNSINAVVAHNTDYGNPRDIAITPDGAYAYVTIQSSSLVQVISTATNLTVATIPVGTQPYGIAITPDGAYAYVADPFDNAVYVIATSTNTVVGSPISVGNSPQNLAITPDGAYVYVTTPGSGDVVVIETAGNTVYATVSLGGDPVDVAITPDGSHAYVTNPNISEVDVIRISDNTESATIPVLYNPDNISVAPDGSHVYVTRNTYSYVDVIQTSDNTDISTINVGNNPTGIVVSPDSGKVYVGALQSSLFPRVYVITVGAVPIRLEYGVNTSGCSAVATWTQVGAPAGSEDWVMSNTGNLNNGQVSTDSAGLSNAPGTFVSGQAMDTASQTGRLTVDGSSFTELEYSIKANSSDTDGTAYCFRLTNAGDPSAFTYAQYAEATLSNGVSATVTAPNGGESLTGGASSNITWSSAGTIDHFKILLSTDSGSSFPTIVTTSTASSPYAWMVNNITTSTARIRVQAMDGSNFVLAQDDSDADFSITSSGPQNPTTTNMVVLSREKVSTPSTADVYFYLPDVITGTLTVYFPVGFNVTGAPTAGSCTTGTIDTFAYSSGARTFTAEKHGCTGSVTLTGGTVVNPATEGSFYVSWINDDPGGAAVPITSEDQILVTASVSPYITFQVNTDHSGANLDCTHGTDGSGLDHAPNYDGGTVELGTLTTSGVASSDATRNGSSPDAFTSGSAVQHICTFVSTNASGGYGLSVKSLNGQLKSASSADAIPAAPQTSGSVTVSPGSTAYALCLSTANAPNMDASSPTGTNLTGTSPFSSSPCTGVSTSQSAGKLTTSTQAIGNNSSGVQEGAAQWLVKASINATTPAHNDYADTLTFIATGTF